MVTVVCEYGCGNTFSDEDHTTPSLPSNIFTAMSNHETPVISDCETALIILEYE